MKQFIKKFTQKVQKVIDNLPEEEIAKALNILEAVYENDGRVYVFGNGGSLSMATHWVSDFNKTVFSHNLDKHTRRFQAIRVPTTEEELTAWANDVGYDMIFAGPLQNYIQDNDVAIAISSSGNSQNIIKAVKLLKTHQIPVIGLSGFDGGELNKLADAKILTRTNKDEYEIVEGVHSVILHLMTKYFQNLFDELKIENDSKKSKCVFLDRDGTIIADVDNLRSIKSLRILPKAAKAIKKLNTSGYKVIVITNQPVIARGWLSIEELDNIHKEMLYRLKKYGAVIDDIYYCPHHPEANIKKYRLDCPNRKPNIGLITKAVEEYNINIEESFFIGDTTCDMETAYNAGLKGILVLTGNGGKDKKYKLRDIYTAKTIYEAITHILKR